MDDPYSKCLKLFEFIEHISESELSALAAARV